MDSLFGQEAKPCPPFSNERVWELRFDTGPLETSYPNLNPDSETTAGLLSPHSLWTRGWHLMCIGIHSDLSDLISCIGVQTNGCLGVVLGQRFYRGELAFAIYSLLKEKSGSQRPFWSGLCHHYNLLTFTSSTVCSWFSLMILGMWRGDERKPTTAHKVLLGYVCVCLCMCVSMVCAE